MLLVRLMRLPDVTWGSGTSVPSQYCPQDGFWRPAGPAGGRGRGILQPRKDPPGWVSRASKMESSDTASVSPLSPLGLGGLQSLGLPENRS